MFHWNVNTACLLLYSPTAPHCNSDGSLTDQTRVGSLTGQQAVPTMKDNTRAETDLIDLAKSHYHVQA